MAVYSPAEIAQRLAVPDRTLRYWSTRFAAFLSPAAMGGRREKGHGHRRFTDADLELLSTVKALAAQKVSLSEIEAILRRASSPPEDTIGSAAVPRPPSPLREIPSAPSRPAVSAPALPAANLSQPSPTREEASLAPRTPPPALPRDRDWPARDLSEGINARAEGESRRQVTPAVAWEAMNQRLDELTAYIAELQEAIADYHDRLVALETSYHQMAALPPEPKRWSLPWPLSLLVRSPSPERGDLARSLARLMAERMITRRELAQRSNISLDELQAILSGRQSRPAPATLQALARALGVALDDLDSATS